MAFGRRKKDPVQELGSKLVSDERDAKIQDLEKQVSCLQASLLALESNTRKPTALDQGHLVEAIAVHKRENWRVRGKPHKIDLALYIAAGLK